jgi:photosystem II stability/assembly factor-like uncharacterized protein
LLWVNKSSGLAGHKLTSLAVDKENLNTVYVGTKGFLFKTQNGGKSWENIFKVPGINKAVNYISIDPQNSKKIYIATESGAFKSGDAGTNWQVQPVGLEEDNVLSLLVHSKDKNLLFAGAKESLFITKDGGRNWIKSSEGLSATNIRCIVQNYIDSNTFFAATDNGLFKSIDGAKTWTKIFSVDPTIEENSNYSEEGEPQSIPTWVSLDPYNPEVIYLCTKREIYKSDDNGNSWRRMSQVGLSSAYIKNLVFSSYNRGFIFAGTEKGVFRFSEEENMWREFSKGFNSKEIIFVALNGNQDTLWLATKNKIYKSKGNIYEVKKVSIAEKTKYILQNFSDEPTYHEIQKVAIEYAEVHPEKIAKWRRAAKTKALFPRFAFRIDQDKGDYYYSGERIGEDEDTGWDITCTWDLGELVWNNDQTLIDVRSKLMVQLRDDVLDEVTHLYFERRRLQIELMQNPPKDVNELVDKELRLQELTADIDAMTGGYLSREIEIRKKG